MALTNALNALKENELVGIAKENPLAVTVGSIAAGGVLAAGIAGTVSAVRKRKKIKRATRRTTTRRKTVKRKTKRTYKYARTAGKRKDTSTKRIRQTKNGQPYIIMASGKAKFISKKSARLSRKRKGGRY